VVWAFEHQQSGVAWLAAARVARSSAVRRGMTTFMVLRGKAVLDQLVRVKMGQVRTRRVWMGKAERGLLVGTEARLGQSRT
jgi:hypothetical protein